MDEQNQAPDVAGEQAEPVDPTIIGKLEDHEMNALRSFEAQSMNIQTQIGGLEVRKAHLLGVMQQLRDQGQHVLDTAAQRLGIQPGEQWTVGSDAIIRRTPNP